MKKLLLLMSILLLISCSEKEAEIDNLVNRNGIMYAVNSKKPFTGKAFSQYENQQMEIIGYYKNGLKNNTWEYFKDNGQISKRENYSQGKLDGLSEEYNDKNIKVISKQYKQDSLHGSFKSYNEKGKLTEDGTFKAGKREGLWTTYYEDLTSDKKNYRNNKLDGEYTRYNSDGNMSFIGTYKQDKKDGVFIEYYGVDKKKRERTYLKNNLLDVKEWSKAGEIYFEAVYPGTSTWYDENGNKQAQGFFTQPKKLKESSLKIWLNGKLFDHTIISKYKWQGRSYRKAKNGFQNEQNGHFNHYFIKKNNIYWKRLQTSDNWNHSWSSTYNRGKYSIDASMLPNLVIEVSPEKSSYSFETYKISSWDGKYLYVNGNKWMKQDLDIN